MNDNEKDVVLSSLRCLAARAKAVIDDLENSRSPEAELVQALTLVKQHPELRFDIAELFLGYYATDPASGCTDLVQFCMHELRWSEVKYQMEQWVAAAESPRRRFFLQRELRAFQDDWSSDGFYAYFSK